MKTRFLTICVSAMLCATAIADTQPNFKALPSSTTCKGVSPTGRFCVGVNTQKKIYTTPMEGYVYDRQSDEFKWVTTYDKNDLSTCGNFADVTDDGIVVGTAKDMDCMITIASGSTTTQTPAFSAAVWKDGVKTLLGYGDFDTSTFSNKNQDGSYGLCISDDGKKVGGYIQAGKSSVFGAIQYPCLWSKADASWTMLQLPVPDGYVRGQVVGMSADGNTVVGQLIGDKAHFYDVILALWKNGTWTPLSIEAMEGDANKVAKMNFGGISPNGKYIAIGFTQNTIWVYDTENDSYRKVTLPGITTSYGTLSVDNLGDVAGVVNIMETINAAYTRPFWYSYKQNKYIDFKYFAELYAPGIDMGMDLDYKNYTDAAPCGLSADGTILFGNGSTAWVLYTGEHNIDIPMTPVGLTLSSNALGVIELTWYRDDFAYTGLTLKKYNVYRNNELIATVGVTADELQKYTDSGLEGGKYRYSLEAVFEKTDGTTMISPMTEDAKINLPTTYSLPLFEDGETGSLDDNFWTGVVEYGDESIILLEANEKKGENYSYGLYTNSICSKPYSYYTMSRPLDATKENKVMMNFLVCQGYVNRNDWDMTRDSLAVEVTVDRGQKWTKVKDWSLAELGHMSWNMKELDLSPFVAGNLFNVRFRIHGRAVAQFWIRLDNIKVGTEPELAAVNGLTGTLSGDKKTASLQWKNQNGAYQLNYTQEMSRGRLSVGNAGNEMIGANLFEPAELKPYDGKYLSAVTTRLNHFDLETGDVIKASAVVLVNGKIVREKELPNGEYNIPVTAVFDEPLKIDATKNIMVGVKVTEYDARQTPVMINITNNSVPGKSDLYSEDGGQTWTKLYDLAEQLGDEDYKRAVWDITADITDEPTYRQTAADEPCTYNVFRNGELISEFALDPTSTRFTDTAHSNGDMYTVVAYYHNGDRTADSELLNIEESSAVNPVEFDGVKVYSDSENGCLRLEGDFDKAQVLDIDGTAGVESCGNTIPIASLRGGVYLLRIEKDGAATVRKIVVR